MSHDGEVELDVIDEANLLQAVLKAAYTMALSHLMVIILLF